MAVESTGDNFGEMLLREGVISETQYQAALRTMQETDQPMGRILVDMGLVSEEARIDFLKKKSGASVVMLDDDGISHSVLRLVPREMAKRFGIVPIRVSREGLVLAMENPLDMLVIDQVAAITKMEVMPAIASLADMEVALKQYDELEDAGQPQEEESSLQKWLHIGYYVVLLILPFALLMIGALVSPAVESMITDAQDMLGLETDQYFDIFLYFFLLLGFYGIILYEIDGLIFSRRKSK
ncbi:hypothetical protein JXA32_04465 [Candidatus Sumerlaeota bacterium]|nr:hypothetical protein [Candidatus Sumerlaeota bacterium]